MPREVQRFAGVAGRVREGIAACREGRFAEAIAALEPLARRKDAAGRQTRRHLGLAHKQAGLRALRARSLDEAQTHLRRAEALLGTTGDIQDALIELHALRGRFDLCEKEIERCLPRRAQDVSLWRRFAQAQWRAGRREEAYLTIQTALRRLGDQAELHLQRGLFLAAEGRLPEARESFARAAEADGECPEAHHYLGLAATATGRHCEAVESLQRAAELRPQDALAVYQLALAARAARQAGTAAAVHLSHLRPGPPPAGGATATLELVEAALKSFEGRRPHELSAGDRAQVESVLRLLQRELTNSPDRPELHGQFAEALETLGRHEEALPHAEQAASLAARAAGAAGEAPPRALVRWGRILAQLGRHEEAVDRLERAVRQGADWADVHCTLAECLGKIGRSSAARAHLDRALRQNPNFRQALGLRARLAA